MEELLTVDGNQYKIAYDQPLTMEQRIQTIEDIRKQTGCGCSEMNNMNNNLSLSLETIQSLQPGTHTQSATVMMLAPAHIWISNISVVGNQTSTCPCAAPPSCGTITCNPSIECSSDECTSDTGNIVVTFSNSGDKIGYLSAISLTLNGVGSIPPDGTVPTTVSGGGTATATFSSKTLTRGSNSISVTYTWSR